MDQWEAELAAGVRAMQRAGEVDAGLDAAREAAALLAGVQGGVLMLMSTGRIGYLEAALDVGVDRLRRPRGGVEAAGVSGRGVCAGGGGAEMVGVGVRAAARIAR
ncbi:hypothetical protein MXD62_13260 [Frankia sp. Mgl5]|nr:hypothetical protein [Frankia sp. Mgl5]MCK9928130.1 hypothetical protein [Frankia sp. Mgl5]